MTRHISARAVALSLISAIALATAAPTQAASVSNDPNLITVVVPAADLNLASATGARALIARIRRAAETLCGIEPAWIQLDLHRIYQTCVNGTVDRAVAKLDNPAVTAEIGPGLAVQADNHR